MDKIAVTIPEAVKISGLGRSTIYNLFNDGKLTARKQGTRTLILVSELREHLESLPTAGISFSPKRPAPSGERQAA